MVANFLIHIAQGPQTLMDTIEIKHKLESSVQFRCDDCALHLQDTSDTSCITKSGDMLLRCQDPGRGLLLAAGQINGPVVLKPQLSF